MQVSYKIPNTGVWIILFDEAAGAQIVMPDFKGTVHFNVNKSAGFGSASQSITAMQNAVVNLPWQFGQTYSSLAAATAAVRTTQLLGGQKLHIRVVQDSETQYYPSGTIESYEWEQTGAYVLHSITFNQNLVTTVEPT